ncbi:hypothetical protein [Halegenticoccus soli]|uniref:hypothetical protein n=1 Tax=Halegenticoccus soli TaxID=1985678 RepID=UPI000C6C9C5A|nr:hypothetical protein [Halegenticoccus soli]
MRRRDLLAGFAVSLGLLSGCSDQEGASAENDRTGDPTTDEGASNSTVSETASTTPPETAATDASSGGTTTTDSGESARAENEDAPPTGDSPTDAAEGVEFDLETGEPRSCGSTCRVVPVTLTNTGSEDARDVVVTMRAEVDGEELDREAKRFDRLDAGATERFSMRSSFTVSEGEKIRSAGGLTLDTTVESETESQTFTDEISI